MADRLDARLRDQIPNLIDELRHDQQLREALLSECDDSLKHIYTLMVGVNQIFYLAVGVLAAAGAAIGVAYRDVDSPNLELIQYAALVAFPLLVVILRQGADTYTEVGTLGGYRWFLERVLEEATTVPIRTWETSVTKQRIDKPSAKFGALPAVLILGAAAVASGLATWDLARAEPWWAGAYVVLCGILLVFVVVTFRDQVRSRQDAHDAALEHWKRIEREIRRPD